LTHTIGLAILDVKADSCELSVGEAELMKDLESLCTAMTSFDVVEPMPDDGDVTEVTRQLELCVV